MKTELVKVIIALSFLLISFTNNLYAQLGAGQRIDVYVQDGTLVTGTNLTGMQWNKITHAVYAFLNPMDNTGSLYLNGAGDPTPPVDNSAVWFGTTRFNNFYTAVKAANPNIKIIISMGGAPTTNDPNITTRLNNILASGPNSTTLANDIATFIQRNDLDGFDFDLEHPQTAAELTNHMNFLNKVKTALNAKEAIMCKELEVSIALNGDCNKMNVSPGGQNYVLPGVDAYVDVYHLMTYDAAASNTTFTTHAPLQMAQDAVTAFSSAPFNWAKNKMMIGIPFYGRNGVGGATAQTYRAINSGNTSGPYNTDITGGFGYNGCPTITSKVNYAKAQGLLGTVVWEGTQDILTGANSLLSCLYTATGLASVPTIKYNCCWAPNLGNDIITCVTATGYPITLNSATNTNTNVTFTWRKIAGTGAPLTLTSASSSANTQVVTSGNGPGTYVVQRDSTMAALGKTCTKTDTIIIAAALPTPDLTPSPRTLCSAGGYTLKPNNATAFPTGTTYQWQKNAVDIGGETTNSLYANSAGTYTLVATPPAGTCSATNGSVIITGTAAVGVDACRTTAGTLNLSVTGGSGTGPYNWYAGDVPNNTLLQANSTTYTTPSLPLPSTTTYYVEDLGAMTTSTVGITAAPCATPFFNAIYATDPITNTTGDVAMEFRVTNNVKLTSVDVTPWGGSSMTAGTPAVFRVEIYNINGGASGIVYTSPNITLTSGGALMTIPLDASLSGSATNPGYYRIRTFVVTNVTPTKLAFGHEGTGAGCTQATAFPFGSGNLVITSERGSATYGPFYNWKFKEYAGCGRIPVRAIVNSNCGTLPVSMLSFEAELLPDHTASLTWTTVNETNNSHFVVQRSVDGTNFTSIGQVNGNNNSTEIINYSFLDQTTPAGTIYYRLAQYDNNGAIEYSRIISIENVDLELKIKPNPFNGSTNIQLHGLDVSAITIRLFDIEGRELDSYSTEKKNDELTIGQNLKPGIYFIQAISSKAVKTYKLIKE